MSEFDAFDDSAEVTDSAERDAFVLMLRSKTAFGRLTDSEVHSVLAFLESIGFKMAPAVIEMPAPLAPPPGA